MSRKVAVPRWLIDQLVAASALLKFIESAADIEPADRATIEAQTRELAKNLYRTLDRSTPLNFDQLADVRPSLWMRGRMKLQDAVTDWRARRVPEFLRPAYRVARHMVWVVRTVVHHYQADLDLQNFNNAMRLFTGDILLKAGWRAPLRMVYCPPTSDARQ